jgi:two-component system NarL family response regulator
MMSLITLLAVEPDERSWRAIEIELVGDPRIRAAHRFQDSQQALMALPVLRPSVALVDMTVPGPATLDLLQQLAVSQPPVGIIGTAETLDDGRVGFALGAGAAACLPRAALPRQTVGTVLEVAAGELPIHREVAGRPQLLTRLIGDFQRRLNGAHVSQAPCPLTARERTVLDMVAGGHANKEIGAALSISERTVKNHMTNILSKLPARDRAHAVRIGMENAWICQGPWIPDEKLKPEAAPPRVRDVVSPFHPAPQHMNPWDQPREGLKAAA